MKIYFSYISLPDRLKKTIELFSIHYTHLEYDKESNIWYGLYGWTTKKDIMNKFKATRNKKYFTYRTLDIDENTVEWEALHTRLYLHLRIRMGVLKDMKNEYLFPMTMMEESAITNKSHVIARLCDRIDNRKTIPVVMDTLSEELSSALDALGFSELVMEYGFYDIELSLSGVEGDVLYEVMPDLYYDGLSYGLGLGGGKAYSMELNTISTTIFMLGDLIDT